MEAWSFSVFIHSGLTHVSCSSLCIICECLCFNRLSLSSHFALLQPPNDPHGITREELIQALRAVLTGTPQFAEVRMRIALFFLTHEDSMKGFCSDTCCPLTVSAAPPHREAGLRCSGCEAGLAADSGEELVYKNALCLQPKQELTSQI